MDTITNIMTIFYNEVKKEFAPTDEVKAKLATHIGFYNKFTSMINQFSTHEEAYEALENIHEVLFYRRKYKNYNSFRNGIKRYIKK